MTELQLRRADPAESGFLSVIGSWIAVPDSTSQICTVHDAPDSEAASASESPSGRGSTVIAPPVRVIAGATSGSAITDDPTAVPATVSKTRTVLPRRTVLSDSPTIFLARPTGAVNIATRLSIGTADDVLIAGFIITGNAPKKLILRAIAPSLRTNGEIVPGALQDPLKELRDGLGELLGTNDDWRASQEREIIDTGVSPLDDRGSAILATLNPGPYTAVYRGQRRFYRHRPCRGL